MGSLQYFGPLGIYIGYTKAKGYSKEGNTLGFNGFFNDDYAWLWILVIIIIIWILFVEEYD